MISSIDLSASGPLVYWLGWGVMLCLVAVAPWRRDPGNLFSVGVLIVLLTYFGFDMRLLMTSSLSAVAAGLELQRRGLGRLWPAGVVSAVLAVLRVLAACDADLGGRQERVRWDRTLEAFVASVGERYPEDVPAGAGLPLAAHFERPSYFLEIAMTARGLEGGLGVIRRRGLEGGLGVIRRRGLEVLIPTPRALPTGVRRNLASSSGAAPWCTRSAA